MIVLQLRMWSGSAEALQISEPVQLAVVKPKPIGQSSSRFDSREVPRTGSGDRLHSRRFGEQKNGSKPSWNSAPCQLEGSVVRDERGHIPMTRTRFTGVGCFEPPRHAFDPMPATAKEMFAAL